MIINNNIPTYASCLDMCVTYNSTTRHSIYTKRVPSHTDEYLDRKMEDKGSFQFQFVLKKNESF